MLVINDKMVDNELTTRDILKYCTIGKVDPIFDKNHIKHIMNKCFKLPLPEAEKLIEEIDYNTSIKFYDPMGDEIYGLLLFTNNEVKKSIPGIEYFNPIIANLFNGLRLKNGEAFILDKRLQGIGLDKLMLNYALKLLKESEPIPEIIWLGVNRELKSHNYWKRHGFIEFYSDMMVRFYFKFLE